MKWDEVAAERTEKRAGADGTRDYRERRQFLGALLIAGAAIFLLAIPFLPFFRA